MLGPVHILGAGASGLAAARLAAAEGRSGCVFSEKPPAATDLAQLTASGFQWCSELTVDDEAEWILSPGFAVEHEWVQTLDHREQHLIPEFEWAAQRLVGSQIAVTGSLGKTSMVMLVAEILKDAGYTVSVSGNIGVPVSEIALREKTKDFHVLELSSFQLEMLQSYRSDRAICLNLFPNHLDRHGDMEVYAQAKARLFLRQTARDIAVWPVDYPVEVVSEARRIDAGDVVLPALAGTPFAQGALRENLTMVMAGLQGIPGVDAHQQTELLKKFRFPAHRMQRVEIPGAGKVIDDSKSTCLTATQAALSQVAGELQLLMGGVDKAESMNLMLPLLKDKRPCLYLFGLAAKKMQAQWQDSVDVCETYDTLDDALFALWETRTEAQTLLFSPGCASFDQYTGYVARGQHFQQLVRQLAQHSPISRNAAKETL